MHVCNKEKEIEGLKVDMEWLKKTSDSTLKKVDTLGRQVEKILAILTSGDNKIKVLNSAVFGNGGGEPGLRVRTSKVEAFINKIKGSLTLLNGLAAMSGISILGLIIFGFKLWNKL